MAKDKNTPNHYVKFTLSEEDHLEFSKYLYAHDKKMKRDRLRGSIPYVILLAGLAVWMFTRGFSDWLPVAFFVVVLFGFGATIYSARNQFLQNTLIIYRQRNHKAYQGEHHLQMIAGGLKNTSNQGDLFVKWKDVVKVEETANYGFLYLSSASAIVIPRKKVIEGNYQALVAAVRKRLERMKP